VTAAEIPTRLGGAQRSGGWWSCRCPAHDDRSPSLSLRDADGGLIVKCFAGRDPRDVLAELRRRGLIGRAAEYRPTPSLIRHDVMDDAARRIAWARRMRDGAREASGTPGAAYLARRGTTHTLAAFAALGAVAAPPSRRLRAGDGRSHRWHRRRADRRFPHLARPRRGWDLAAPRPGDAWLRCWRRGAARRGGRDVADRRGRRNLSRRYTGNEICRLGRR
jgi:hypothetical protein